MIVLNLLQKAMERAVDSGDDELSGELAEYIAAAHGDWGSFADPPKRELVDEVAALFGHSID